MYLENTGEIDLSGNRQYIKALNAYKKAYLSAQDINLYLL
jgi:hypothetical protein